MEDSQVDNDAVVASSKRQGLNVSSTNSNNRDPKKGSMLSSRDLRKEADNEVASSKMQSIKRSLDALTKATMTDISNRDLSP